ncbi:hypothetical protein N7456_002395 [Penicillium angulare]|uniref:5'-3' DNA helicase ZGRF1-like N-terminal domain-containing protein n=1 Tax=Penicillium angulare TaxID=116970 RepID=A0A9W9G840_9EURO|nr:hypothetical protein N7456_002395 [Penicillium angulare]
MSTPSSSTRALGSGPGSQILSSVIKFRCLFTYDLRRKSKRWRDGYLKYHAFNKRVMVYDEHANYVGDHHWRSGEEVQDGDELELDKGVLIEVGERMSTTQTDISNLFEKRRSSQNSPPSRNSHAGPEVQAPRSSTSTPAATTSTPIRPTISSQPFRPLNDLLGIKKGSPAQKGPPAHTLSPYEQRHRAPPPPPSPPRPDIPQPSQAERAPKRQKVSTGNTATTEVQLDVVDLTEIENGHKSPPREAARPSKSSKAVSSMPPPREKPKPANTARPTRPDPPIANSTRPLLPDPTTTPAPKQAHEETPKEAPKETRKEVAVSKDKPTRRPEEQNQRNNEPVSSENGQSQASASMTRIPMQRTRNKFMYGAILQRQSSVSSAENSQPASKPVKPHKSRPEKPTEAVKSTNPEFLPSDSTQSIFDEIEDAPGFENGRSIDKENFPTRRSFDKPLRKSLSDPSALTNKPSLQNRPTLMRSAMSAVPEDSEIVEEGPWTSEAQDLFDYWPKGLPKPT